MQARRPTLLCAALLAAGTVVVHELRYLLAYGTDAPEALAAQGHGYLSAVIPFVGLIAALALGFAVMRIGQGRGGSGVGSRRSLWLAATAALYGLYAGQELLEGALAPGHPGLDALIADGGWIALPVAAAVTGLGVAFVRVAGDAAGRLLAGRAVALPGLPAIEAPVPALGVTRPAGRVMGRHLAGRAPPHGC